jgi:Spy/CpxP family protein refolding chaperone
MNKKLISAVAVVALFATMAVAAPHEGRRREHRREAAQKFARRLNLSDGQRQQIREMHQGFRAENAAFFQSFRQNRRDYRAAKQAGDTAKADALKATLQSQRAQAKELHAGLEQRVGSVLTADQLAQWNAMKAERAARRAQRRGQR